MRKRTIWIVAAGILSVSLLLLSMVACTSASPPPAGYAPPVVVVATNASLVDAVSAKSNANNSDFSSSGGSAGEQATPGAPQQVAQKRIVLKNATLAIVVQDTAQTLNAIADTAEKLGGWVVNSTTSQQIRNNNVKLTYGTITIRVPAEKLTDTLTTIRSAAVSVQSENITGDDVTQNYTDLTSQLTNLEAAEAQLRKIMESTDKTVDVLAVYRELITVRGQIERIKGQLKYYDEASAYSSITVTLSPEDTAQPLVIAGWHPGSTARTAIQTLVSLLQNITDAAIWLAIVVLPFAVLVLIIGFLYRRFRRRSVSVPPPVQPASE
ncbi:MAG: DUF4349 domain-containing protein [Chloroflexota bacterium]